MYSNFYYDIRSRFLALNNTQEQRILEKKSATKIQSQWKGSKARKEFTEMKAEDMVSKFLPFKF